MDVVANRWPSLVDYAPYPARHWFTHTGLRRELAEAGFADIIDAVHMTTPRD